jgi:uracil-DNA glycosylase family 4
MQKSVIAKELEELARQIMVCVKCSLSQSRRVAVPGEGNPRARIMIIGEAPGRLEDETGRPFVGAAGRSLDRLLKEIALNRSDLFITNVVKCRPPQNRPPKKSEVDTCVSNYLLKQIELINPKLIMLLGSVAARRLLGVESLEEARGRVFEHNGCKYIVGYHPASTFYRNDLKEKIKEDFALLKHELDKLQ